MALLPEEQRTAIVLKEYHGLTFQEIADLVGCPLSTVKTRLYQGLTVLRRELAKNWKATVMTELMCGYSGDREEALVASLYDDGDPAERAAFDAHLTTCARCRDELDALRGVRAQLGRWAPPEPSFAVVSRAVVRSVGARLASRGGARFPRGRRSRPRCCSSACPPASPISTCTTTRAASASAPAGRSRRRRSRSRRSGRWRLGRPGAPTWRRSSVS